MMLTATPNPDENQSEALAAASLRRNHREALLQPLVLMFGIVASLLGIAIPLMFFFVADFPRSAIPIGFLWLLTGAVSGLIYVTPHLFSHSVKSGLLVFTLLAMGCYMLFANWLTLGIIVLLIAVLVSVILFTIQIGIFVLAFAQIFVSSILMWKAWYAPNTAEIEQIIEQTVSNASGFFLLQFGAIFIVVFLLSAMILNAANGALQRQSELRGKLELERQMLEQKVVAHTRTLNVTGEVNRLISTILDANTLVGDVVEQIRQAFNYYHVQIYLIQPEENVLRIAGATGEAGTALLIGHHQLALEAGIVGQTAKTGQPSVVPNVKESADFVPNSLLPDTVAEIAVPIIWEDRVLGVLDVQHDRPFELAQNDINVLQTIALQLGTAISNVNIFQQAEEHLKRESILNNMSLKLQVAPDIESSMQIVGKNISQVLEPLSVKVSIDPELLDAGGNGS